MIDPQGNRLLVKLNGEVGLKLSMETRIRKIGMLARKDGKRIYEKYEDSIFRKFDAFGFCYEAIRQLKPDEIKVYYNGNTYTITMEKFGEKKKFLNFKNKGYELRCYVPVSEFTRYRGIL